MTRKSDKCLVIEKEILNLKQKIIELKTQQRNNLILSLDFNEAIHDHIDQYRPIST